ncbi:Cytochrome c-type biogenesis protein CcmE [bacterium HR40]|nr:Cytochrome c-type biogenesis protein CcmE [bacterium HR40]
MRLRKRQRALLVLLVVALVGGATALVLAALRDSISFFVTPSQLAAGKVEPGRRLRIGGLVEAHSIVREADGSIRFRVTDTAAAVTVHYKGMLPDLFREGQGVVATGVLSADGTFRAEEVLARHDERYMPREVADALKEAGYWQDTARGGGAGAGGDAR